MSFIAISTDLSQEKRILPLVLQNGRLLRTKSLLAHIALRITYINPSRWAI